ncbi:MAG: transcriptional regulator [Phenylobacterium sp.]|nr:MAG: transcriptional regulator [Phenylobacterium sp.]
MLSRPDLQRLERAATVSIAIIATISVARQTRSALPEDRVSRSTRTGRPIMLLLDLVGRRWMLRILWELRDGPLTSRALRAACDEASPTVLQARLAEMREGGLVTLQDRQGYGLTPLGRELLAAIMPLYAFADRWAGRERTPAS